MANRLPTAWLQRDGRGLLTLADLGIGWSTSPGSGLKAFSEHFQGGNCGGPDLVARSRGNNGVNEAGFQTNPTTGPFFSEFVVIYPDLDAAKFGYHDTALSYACGQWTDSDAGEQTTISDLPAFRGGNEAIAKRETTVVTSKYCNVGQVIRIVDTIEIRVRFQFMRFVIENDAVSSQCHGWAPATPPDDALLYRFANKGVNKYLGVLREYTKKLYELRTSATTAP